MNPTVNNDNYKTVWLVLSVLAVVIALYLIGSTIYVSQTTGQLNLTSTDNTAMLVISQTDRQAKIIGTGQTKIHLKPGTYEVSANNTNAQAYAVVKITKKQTTVSSLTPSNAPKLLSPESINFVGNDGFIVDGVTVNQISALKQAFFNYAPKAHTITVSSIKPEPHNRYSANNFDSIKFTATIDKTTYNARIDYSNLTVVELYLSNPQTGAQVFDSKHIDETPSQ